MGQLGKKIEFIEKLNQFTDRIANFYEIKQYLSYETLILYNPNISLGKVHLDLIYLSTNTLHRLGFGFYPNKTPMEISKDRAEFVKNKYHLYFEAWLIQYYLLYCLENGGNAFNKSLLRKFLCRDNNICTESEVETSFSLENLIIKINNHNDYLDKLEQLIKVNQILTMMGEKPV